MFLLILESIGTSELLLVAVVALIVFGPRKLPEIAKKFGKTMAEFRNATNEFKSTWEREAAFEDNAPKTETTLLTDTVPAEKTIGSSLAPVSANENPLEPKVRELSSEEAAKLFQNKNETLKGIKADTDENLNSHAPETEMPPPPATKRDWL